MSTATAVAGRESVPVVPDPKVSYAPSSKVGTVYIVTATPRET